MIKTREHEHLFWYENGVLNHMRVPDMVEAFKQLDSIGPTADSKIVYNMYYTSNGAAQWIIEDRRQDATATERAKVEDIPDAVNLYASLLT